MALDFPAAPVVGDLYTFGTITWRWDGVGWSKTNNYALAPWWLRNPDWVDSSVGSATKQFLGAASGNTYSAIQAYTAGSSAVGVLALNPSGGNIGIGTTNPAVRLGQKVDIANSAASGGLVLSTWSAVTTFDAPLFDFARSRSSTIGTHAAVVSGDTLGNFVFRGSDGTGFVSACSLIGTVGGAVSAGHVPGRLAFFTASTTVGQTERMFIDANGNVGISNSGALTANSLLTVNATAGSLVRLAEFTTPTMSNGQKNYIMLGDSAASNKGFYISYNHDATAANRCFSIQAFEAGLGTQFNVTAAGNVGIGTASPAYLLDVAASATSSSSIRLRHSGILSTAGQSIFFSDSTPTNIAEIQSFLFGTSYGLKFRGWNGTTLTDVMSVRGDGVVVITSLASGSLTSASGVITSSSDAELKTRRGEYAKSIDALLAMGKPIYYNWNEKSDVPAEGRDEMHVGWTAQDVRDGIPEAVYTGKDGKLSLNDRAILATLFNAMLDMHGEIQRLRMMLD